MLPKSLARILAEVPENATVLDVGGWGRPLARANWVMDLMPYETRGLYGRDGEGSERFGPETWIRRDICDREPYPFADDEIDFAVCSHTLEDVRDPIWACQEMARIARAGYVEVPSRLEEQSLGVKGHGAGWSHHRWLVDVVDGNLEFVYKHDVVHFRPGYSFPRGFHARLAPEERVSTLWWQGGFQARERVMVGADEVHAYFARFVAAELARRPMSRGAPRRLARALPPAAGRRAAGLVRRVRRLAARRDVRGESTS